jgi:hypothetical protein
MRRVAAGAITLAAARMLPGRRFARRDLAIYRARHANSRLLGMKRRHAHGARLASRRSQRQPDPHRRAGPLC